MHSEQKYFLKSALHAFRYNALKSLKGPFKTILVIKWDEIGDMATATHVFSLLKKAHSESTITLSCKPIVKGLVQNDPHIDEIIHHLPDTIFDLVVELRGNDETLAWTKAHPPKLRLERGKVRILNKLSGGQPHERVTNYKIIKPVLNGLPNESPQLFPTKKEMQAVQTFLSQHQIKHPLILHTGARDKARRWPKERFIKLAETLRQQYNLTPIWAGGPDEVSRLNGFKDDCSVDSYVFAGDYSLGSFAALCSMANLFIGNESGPMHIANNMDVPIIALFSKGVRDVFYPVGKHTRVIHYFKSDGHTEQTEANSTILKITVTEVLAKAKELITP